MKSIESQLADAQAEILMQNQMIDGARKAASKMMCQITEMRHALDRIRMRDLDTRPAIPEVRASRYAEQFEMCKLIAQETVQKVDSL